MILYVFPFWRRSRTKTPLGSTSSSPRTNCEVQNSLETDGKDDDFQGGTWAGAASAPLPTAAMSLQVYVWLTDLCLSAGQSTESSG